MNGMNRICSRQYVLLPKCRRLHSSVQREFDQFTVYSSSLDFQPSHTDRQFETPWSGTSRIDEKNSFAFFDRRPVRMSAHHDIKSCCGRSNLELFEVMDDVDANAADLHDVCFRNRARSTTGNRTDCRSPRFHVLSSKYLDTASCEATRMPQDSLVCAKI